ncbi:MAG: Lrp/AsnC ligand binding domain-containing protein, partial [Acidimicrobiales bacterium]
MEAYVLVQTEVGAAADVCEEIVALEGVVSAEATTGPYDVIARVQAESVDAIGQLVVSRLHFVGRVTR